MYLKWRKHQNQIICEKSLFQKKLTKILTSNDAIYAEINFLNFHL